MTRPFFIIGCGSSGSTLLSVLLDRHSKIACGPELSVFNKRKIFGDYKNFTRNLPLWLEKGLSTSGRAEYRAFFFNLEAYSWDKVSLIKLAKNARDHRQFFDEFFLAYLRRRGKEIWGEKTGSNSYCVSQILQIYPNARFIHMVRDGRDVVCSFMKRPGNTAYHSVCAWLYEVSAALAWEGTPFYTQIKYEDLVSMPERELRRICHHIGIEFEGGMLRTDSDDYWKSYSSGNVHESWSESPFSGSISSQSVGRYKNDMKKDIELLFWKTRLTPFAKRTLRAGHVNTTGLMMKLGYIDHPPSKLDQLPIDRFLEFMKEECSRFMRHIRLDHEIRFPQTWAIR